MTRRLIRPGETPLDRRAFLGRAGLGVGALALMARGAARGARLLAVLAVAAVVVGWGVAQWDYLLPETLTVSQAAAPTGTITAVLVVAVLAALLIAPAFALLYTLDQKSLLPDEGVHDGPQQPTEIGRGPNTTTDSPLR